MTTTATHYAVIREDVMGAATMLQNHEKTLRQAFTDAPIRAEHIRKLANELFDAIDELHHDATSGKEL